MQQAQFTTWANVQLWGKAVQDHISEVAPPALIDILLISPPCTCHSVDVLYVHISLTYLLSQPSAASLQHWILLAIFHAKLHSNQPVQVSKVVGCWNTWICYYRLYGHPTEQDGQPNFEVIGHIVSTHKNSRRPAILYTCHPTLAYPLPPPP